MFRLVVLLISFVTLSCSVQAQVRVAIPLHVKGTNLPPVIEAGFGDIYKAIDQDVTLEYLTVARAFELVKQGHIDALGYFTELSSFENNNLFKVPEPLTDVQLFVACYRGQWCTLNSNGSYVFVGEELFTERFCQARGLDCISVADERTAFKTVQSGLADGYILERVNVGVGECYSHMGVELRPIEGQHFELYHYVDIELASKANLIAESIRRAKQTAKYIHGYSHCEQDIAWEKPFH